MRGWHEGDMGAVDADEFDQMLSAARKHEAAVQKANAEANRR